MQLKTLFAAAACILIYGIYIQVKKFFKQSQIPPRTDYEKMFENSTTAIASIRDAKQIQSGQNLIGNFHKINCHNPKVARDTKIMEIQLEAKKRRYDPKGI